MARGDGLSGTATNDQVEDDFEFDCPECGTHIRGEVDHCPKCGVEFVIEEVADIECPHCHATVSGESVTCPECGRDIDLTEPAPVPAPEPAPLPPAPAPPASTPPVSAPPPAPPKPPEVPEAESPDKLKAAKEKMMKEEFSELVNEVGPLLTLAKDYSIDTTATRRLIDKAVALGKRREIEPAVETMRECRGMLQQVITDRLERDIMYLENLEDVARKMGSDHETISSNIAESKEKLAEKDFAAALELARSGKRQAEVLTGKYVEAHELYESLEKLILNSERFYLDVRESRKLLNEARDAGETGDWNTMGILSRKGREELNKALPDMLAEELRKAKQSLLEAKAKGKDVTSMVKLLKDAGVSMKRGRHEEVLDRLIEFRAEEKRL
ncbi:MAG: Double zinc ribbon [Methanomassiliicoccales archaeon PtaU1.Bin030]|nr:MAG: Double zinc ribbon [Methanomassiliicoccales archaeon PtaU1.Bin030]